MAPDIMKDAFKQNKVDIIPIEDEDWSLMQGIEDVSYYNILHGILNLWH